MNWDSVALLVAFTWLSLLFLVLRVLLAVANQKDQLDQLHQTVERREKFRVHMGAGIWKDILDALDRVVLLEKALKSDDKDLDALHLIEERLDQLEERLGLGYAEGDVVVSQEQLDQIVKDWGVEEATKGDRREERCLTGQCDPVGCERELCPHRTVEFTVSPFRGVLHQFDGQEIEDTVLLQQAVQIDLADERQWEKEPTKELGIFIPCDGEAVLQHLKDGKIIWGPEVSPLEPPQADTQPPTKVM